MSTDAQHPASMALPLETARDNLARNVSAARSALGISQEQLGENAGVSRATINQLEAADGDPRLSTLAGVAAALDVSLAFLLIGRDELDAIAHVLQSGKAKLVQDHLTSDELETMRRLLLSGIPKNRTKVVALGVGAAAAAGFASVGGVLAGAAIGSLLIPGIGTGLVAGLMGALSARKAASTTKDK